MSEIDGKGRVAIVTGAASGIGRATAVKLGQRGFSIAAMDRDETRLDTTVELLRQADVPCLGLPVDVSDRAAVDEAVERATSELGQVWALAAAAGIARDVLALDADDEHYELLFRVNTLGVIHANVAAARSMIAAGQGGRIVNFSSRGAIGGVPGVSAYCLSKAAVSSFTQSFALEVAGHGITVNVVLPGATRTPMVHYMDGDWAEPELAKVPVGRWGEPEDLAAMASFLLSDEASWITASAHLVDGGATAAMGRSFTPLSQVDFNSTQA